MFKLLLFFSLCTALATFSWMSRISSDDLFHFNFLLGLKVEPIHSPLVFLLLFSLRWLQFWFFFLGCFLILSNISLRTIIIFSLKKSFINLQNNDKNVSFYLVNNQNILLTRNIKLMTWDVCTYSNMQIIKSFVFEVIKV